MIYNHETYTHTHTHPFNGLFSGTTRVSQYQKGKTNLDFSEARDSEWQWHQLGHMQVCISLQTDNHANTSPLAFFTGRMPFLPPNQQCQSTEGTYETYLLSYINLSIARFKYITSSAWTYNHKGIDEMWARLKKICTHWNQRCLIF